jgi:hypothetical protein
MKLFRNICAVAAWFLMITGLAGCSIGVGGGFSGGSPGLVGSGIPGPPPRKVISPFPGVAPILLNVPVRVREGVNSVVPGDVQLTGDSERMKLSGIFKLSPKMSILELSEGMSLPAVRRAVAAQDSKLVLDPLLSTPEFEAFVIEGKFSSFPQTVYYFEAGVYLGSGTPPGP